VQYLQKLVPPRGPYISVYELDLIAPGLAWADAQGNYYISMTGGWAQLGGPASIAQTGYLSPSTRCLRFRGGSLSSLVVSFAGETLSCVVVSSNSECAADISKFSGTTGELKFVAPGAMAYLDSIWFSNQPVSNTPPSAPTIALSETGDSRVRLTFPAQLGTTYFVQATTNLTKWETVGSIQATNDPAEFFDNPAVSYRTRYYRVVVPP